MSRRPDPLIDETLLAILMLIGWLALAVVVLAAAKP